MGDRANILVRANEADPGVYLYTHWCGTELPAILQTALRKKLRWTDAPYLTRIIFCTMLKGNEEPEERGFGISTSLLDNEYPILEVDVDAQTVSTLRERDRVRLNRWTFTEFCELAISTNPVDPWKALGGRR